jgi:hypothetical protein
MLAHIVVFILGACVCAVLQHKTEYSETPPMLPKHWFLSVVFGLAGLGLMKINDSLNYGFTPTYIYRNEDAPEGSKLRWGSAGKWQLPVIYDKEREALIGIPEGAIYLHYNPFYDGGSTSERGASFP